MIDNLVKSEAGRARLRARKHVRRHGDHCHQWRFGILPSPCTRKCGNGWSE